MRLAVLKKVLTVMALSGGVLLGSCFTSCAKAEDAAAPKTAETKAAKEAAPAKKKEKKFSGRLPVFYGEVVSGEQREKIYAIQMGYADEMAALVAQVKALQAKQMAEIEAVLSEEQKKRVEELRAEALAKRKSREVSAKASSSAEAK